MLGRKVNTFFTSNSKLFFKVVEPVNTPSSCCFTSLTTFGNVGFLNFTHLKCLLLRSEKALPWFLMRLSIFSYVYLPLILAFFVLFVFSPIALLIHRSYRCVCVCKERSRENTNLSSVLDVAKFFSQFIFPFHFMVSLCSTTWNRDAISCFLIWKTMALASFLE